MNTIELIYENPVLLSAATGHGVGELIADSCDTGGGFISPSIGHLTAIGRALFDVRAVCVLTLEQHERLLAKFHDGRRGAKDAASLEERRRPSEPIVVLDTLRQEERRHCPAVLLPPNLRFYAEAALHDSTGTPVGMLCLLHESPKPRFSADDRALLKRLAALAAAAIEDQASRTRSAETQQALLDLHEIHQLVTRATGDGIWDWKRDSGSVLLSAHLQTMLGLPEMEVLKDTEEWLRRIHPRDLQQIRCEIERLRASSRPDFECEYRIRHEDGGWRWFRSRAAASRDADGRLCRLTGTCTDVTAERSRDQLTGLASRLFLLNALDARLREGGPDPFALLVIDLNQFKRVNDSFGHAAGDCMLIETAHRISLTLGLHAEDISARIVGDEFAVLLDRIHSRSDALEYAARLHALVATQMLCNEQPMKLSASIGVAFGPADGSSAEQMLHDAETAMHQAKACDHPQTAVFCPRIRERAFQRMSLAAELRGALQNESLMLHYQPKVQLATGKLLGFEALLRWPHPTRGLIPPDEFISLAEESDLIFDIGRWTLRESIRQLAEWRAEGLVPSKTTVAVNLSARQFADDNLIESILCKLRAHDLPPACLSLEVTEGMLISDVARAQQVLQQLKAIHVGLELDDFGTGYSSMKYLQSFPFDSLKVDSSFVSELGRRPEAAAIAHSIVTLGKALKMRLVAEGVETVEQAAMLRSMGCECAQGYLYSRPLPASQMRSLLQRSSREKGSLRLPAQEGSLLLTSAA